VQAEIGEQWLLVLGLVFMAMVIFVPGGFADLGRRVGRAVGKRIRRRRHNVPDMEADADRLPSEPPRSGAQREAGT
jgi:hypothetical protein